MAARTTKSKAGKKNLALIPAALRFDFNSPDLIADMQLPPTTLYHYTNAKGFIGIIESQGHLRATHHRFLNDKGEVRFGFELANAVLHELRDELPRKVLKLAEKKFSEELVNGDSYISCLSATQNSLSQWRSYANEGAGYCLGLRSRERAANYTRYGDDGETPESWTILLLECIYGPLEVARIIRERFQRILKLFKERGAELGKDERVEGLASHLLGIAWRYAHVAKHEHFKDEQEWRYVVDAPRDQTQFREGPLGLTPFLQTDQLHVEEVWIGPAVGPSPEIAKRVTMHFLEDNKIKPMPKVEVWESPYVRR